MFVIGASNQQELPDLPARQGILDSTLKKSPVGSSGADLAGVCQYAAEAGIRDAIAAEVLKAGDDAMDADGICEIGRKHFEEAYDHSRASVSATDFPFQ